MQNLELLLDLYRDTPRQGPGSDRTTGLAVELSGLRSRAGLAIADIGCGTGAAALALAGELDAVVTGVDIHGLFLGRLRSAAQRAGVDRRIRTLAASMDSLPFGDGSLDAIWSEGAIYHMGFAAGVRAWRRFLKPGGVLAVSELTWLTAERPTELHEHWKAEYPEVDTAAAKIAVLEQNGFSPLGYFPLPRECWLEHFYRPLEARFPAFLARHGSSAAANAIVAAERREIDLYERYWPHVSYGFYVARKCAP